jgi:DNA-binding winged helix-turn-helix (wHTH) protein
MTQEVNYDQTFRHDDVVTLAEHLANHHSVALIGMKRVGINNFLKFFLNHQQVITTFLPQKTQHLFIHIDLNDLVERDIYPFWTLTLKRLVDAIERLPNNQALIGATQKLFTESIQLKDLFFTVDSVRKILALLVENNHYPILIFNRFDRMKDAATHEFFNNLQSLKDHALRNLSYIFTSFRPLYELNPLVFTKAELSVFCHDMYIKPAQNQDASIILKAFEQNYRVNLLPTIRTHLLDLSGGHVQYLHLSMIKLRDTKTIPEDTQEITTILLKNEETTLLSEELFESLSHEEQVILSNLTKNQPAENSYLTQTGILTKTNDVYTVFSPLFNNFLQKKNHQLKNGSQPQDFTKKEHALFSFLQDHENRLCEREDIIEAVWPDYAESGVSDWAIDRLVARVRTKLKTQKSEFEIVTVITRGYKLQRITV